MKTKVIVEVFTKNYIKELNRNTWTKDYTSEIAEFKTKKQAMNFLRDMKKFADKNWKNSKGEFTEKNEYRETWKFIQYYYRIVKA